MASMPNPRELELKLTIAPDDVERLQLSGPLAAPPTSSKRQDSVYFDTPEHDLAKAGLTLRVRRSGDSVVQTVKTRSNSVGLFHRDEWEMPVGTMKPDLNGLDREVADRLPTSTRTKLDPIASISIDRTDWTIADESHVIEVSLDEGSICAGGETAEVSGVELELKHGPEKALFDLCDQLSKCVSLRLDVRTKPELAEALADGRLDTPAKPERIKVRDDMTVGEGFTLIGLSCARHFRLNEDLLRKNGVPEALHQLHVSTRRLQTLLRLFRPVVGGKTHRRLLKELRRFGSTLGEARNYDVITELLAKDALDLPHLERFRRSAYDRVFEVLASKRSAQLMLTFVRWLHIGKWRRRSSSNAPLSSFFAWRLDKSWARLRDEGGGLADMSDAERHRLRIRIKHFRYALEFAQGLHRGVKTERKAFRRALESIQEKLGSLNDARVASRLAGRKVHLPVRFTDPQVRFATLGEVAADFGELNSIGSYWRRAPLRRREAAAARRQGEAARPAASRRRGPRSAEFARGSHRRPG